MGKEPETPPAESVLRITPVWKEPPAAREQGPRDQDISHGRLAWKRIRPQFEGQLGKNLAVFFGGSTVELTATTPTIESAAKEGASAENTPIEGRSVARAAVARESKGAWTTGGRRGGDTD